jgi:hypothetical protein
MTKRENVVLLRTLSQRRKILFTQFINFNSIHISKLRAAVLCFPRFVSVNRTSYSEISSILEQVHLSGCIAFLPYKKIEETVKLQKNHESRRIHEGSACHIRLRGQFSCILLDNKMTSIVFL